MVFAANVLQLAHFSAGTGDNLYVRTRTSHVRAGNYCPRLWSSLAKRGQKRGRVERAPLNRFKAATPSRHLQVPEKLSTEAYEYKLVGYMVSVHCRFAIRQLSVVFLLNSRVKLYRTSTSWCLVEYFSYFSYFLYNFFFAKDPCKRQVSALEGVRSAAMHNSCPPITHPPPARHQPPGILRVH